MAPLFTILNDEADRLEFRIDGRSMPVPYGNAIRRFLLSRIPVVAVHRDSVKLSAEEGFLNGTSDDDELIRRQLGWIPLIVPIGQEVGLTFRICDPDDRLKPLVNRALASMWVTCRHVLVERDGVPVPPETVFAHLDFPITSIGNGESILCEFHAAVGTCAENQLGERCTDYQPLSVAIFRYEIDPRHEERGFTIPDEQQYTRLEGKGTTAPAGIVGTLELTTIPSTYTCRLSMERALERLIRDLETLQKAWENNDETFVRIEEDTPTALTAYWMNTDGHSIFGMFQHAFNEIVDEEKLDKRIYFCGHRETHPQEKQMLVTLLTPENGKLTTREFFQRAFQRMLQRCNTLLTAWIADMAPART